MFALRRLGILLQCLVVVGLLGTVVQAQQNAPEEEAAEQAYLGIGVAPIPEPLVAHISEIVGAGRGVMIAQVMEASPAERAGLRKYDVVVRYNDQDVYAPEQLVKLVRNDKPGNVIKLEVVRGGKVLELQAKLEGIPVRPTVRGRLAERFPGLQRWMAPREGSGILPRILGPRDRDQASPQGQAARPQEPSREQGEGNRPERPWKKFESMTVTKLKDGQYKVEINYIDGDEKHIHREYVGTREEIKKAVDADNELPPDEREHLLRALDMQEQPPLLIFPELELLERELFNWPHLDF